MGKFKQEIIKSATVIMAALTFLLWVIGFMPGRCFALDAGFTVQQIRAVDTILSGVNHVTPALVRGASSGAPVLEWGAINITPAVASSVMGRVIAGAGVLGAAYYGGEIISYLYDKGYEYIQGELNITTEAPATVTYPWLTDNGSCGGTTIRYATSAAACAAGWCSCSYIHIYSEHVYKYTGSAGCGHANQTACEPEAAYEENVTQTSGGTTTAPATEAQIAAVVSGIQTDLTNADPDVQAMFQKMLGQISNALGNTNDPLAKAAPQVVANIRIDLAGAVTQTQKDSMDATAAAAGSAKVYAQQSAQVTPDSLKQAVSDVMDDGGGVAGPSLTAETIPDPPEKTTITSVLNTWFDGFKQLPVVSMFTGLTVTASGSAVIAFEIPSFMGGSSTDFSYDMSKHSDTWAFMGNVLLMITGIRWTMYLFEG